MALSKTGRFLSKAEILGVRVFSPFQFGAFRCKAGLMPGVRFVSLLSGRSSTRIERNATFCAGGGGAGMCLLQKTQKRVSDTLVRGGPPQFSKKRSENEGANENLSGGFAAIPGIAPRVAPRIVGFVLIKS